MTPERDDDRSLRVGYPYKLKALIGVMANPVYGQTGLKKLVGEKLADPAHLPLYVAVDGFINETNTYADYIVPDSVMYEVWGFAGAWSGHRGGRFSRRVERERSLFGRKLFMTCSRFRGYQVKFA